ncbi:MAG: histidine kinase dimerization/phosphoacceptor domain -containing protein [Verrucomicrobiota bacterium]
MSPSIAIASTTGNRTRPGILRRFMLITTFVAALTIGTFALVMVIYQKHTIRNDLETTATSLASYLDQAVSDSFSRSDYADVVKESLRFVSERPDMLYAVITRREDGFSLVNTSQGWHGAQLSEEWNPNRDSQPVSEMKSTPFSAEEALTLTRRADASGIDWGWIHIGLSLENYHKSINAVYSLTGIVAVIIFSVGSLIAFVFARQITLPVAALRRYAHEVAAGALDQRVEIKSHDEIGDLAESINKMVNTLMQSQSKLKDSIQQTASLREKEILLREIHHRVKNNMQILSSLFRLQARRADNDEMRTVLTESESRIRSMGLLHEKLYKSESISRINLHDYLRSLTNEIMRMSTGRTQPVNLQLNANGVTLGLDTALPCGLIVTELVSNSLKYAFPDQTRPGNIIVSVNKTDDGVYTLLIWDDGVGLPENFDVSQCKSLGMRLVTMLTDQLHGEFYISGKEGTRTEITFQESQYKNRF